MKPIKLSIAFVIYNPNRSKILIVKRPVDADSLPGFWGLPAGSLKKGESYKSCVIRSGREKLGVTIKPVKLIGQDTIEREKYTLKMKEYEVRIIKGQPKVPQKNKKITQYEKWKWGTGSNLKPAAKKGSLCSRIYLKNVEQK